MPLKTMYLYLSVATVEIEMNNYNPPVTGGDGNTYGQTYVFYYYKLIYKVTFG